MGARLARAVGLAVAVVVLATGGHVEAAAKKKIILLDFKGPRASRAQRSVIKLLKGRVDLVGEKEFAAAAREIEDYSPDAAGVARVAGRLQAHGVLTGKISKRGSRYKLTLQVLEGRTGKVVGKGITVPLKRGRLGSDARSKAKRELNAILSELPEPSLAGEPVASASDGADEESEAAAAREALAKLEAEKEAKERAEAEAAAAAERERERARQRQRARRTRVASAEDVRASARRRPAPPPPSLSPEEAERADLAARGRAIDLSAGASFVMRRLTFEFADGLAGSDQPQGYSGALVPAVYAAAELYPVALVKRDGRSWVRDIGISLFVDKVLIIKSKLQGVDGDALPTAQTRFGAGLVYRWNFGSTPTSPTLEVGARFNKLSFTIDETAAANPAQIEIPDVSYTYIDPGLGFRMPFGDRFTAVAEGRYMFVLDAGQIENADRYGDGSTLAFDADVAGEVKLTSNLLARIGGRFTQVGFDFDGNGELTDPSEDGTQDVTSATDRYYGFYATAGILF